MSTQQMDVLLGIPQSNLFELESGSSDTFKYWLIRLLGCWHLRMSRPFTHGRDSYCVCLRCGRHRAFDVQDWRSIGRYYSPSVERGYCK